MKSLSLGQKLFAQGSIYGLSRVLNKAAGFFLIPLYAHLLGDEGYGLVSLMTAIGAFATLLLGQGLPGAWFRLRFNEQTEEGLRRFEATVVWHLGLSVLAGLGLVSLFGERLAAAVTPGVPYWPYGFLTVVHSCGIVFVQLLERKLQAEQRPLAYACVNLLNTLVIYGTIVVFVAGFRWGAGGKIAADATSALLLAVVALAVIRPAGPWQFSRARARSSLAYGLPLVPHALAGQVNAVVGRVLVNRQLGMEATGVYAMGHQIGALGNEIGIALNRSYAPLFIAGVRESEEAQQRGDLRAAERARSKVARGGLLMVFAVTCAAYCLTAGVREMLWLLTTPAFSESWRATAPVALASVALASYLAFGQGLLYTTRSVRWAPVVSFTAAAVNVAANLVLLPRLGFMGAAYATLISNTVMAATALIVARRHVKISYAWSRWIGLYALCIMALSGFYAVDAAMDVLWPRVAVKAGLLAVSLPATAWCCGVSPNEARALLTRLTAKFAKKRQS